MTAENDLVAKSADHEFGSTMAELITDRWETIWQALPNVMEGDDLNGVHDARVAARQLRVAMEVSSDVFPSSWFKPLHRFVKNLSSKLGKTRDQEVLLEFLEAELEQVPIEEKPGIDRLIRRVSAEREEARASLLEFLECSESSELAAEAVERFRAHRLKENGDRNPTG